MNQAVKEIMEDYESERGKVQVKTDMDCWQDGWKENRSVESVCLM